MIQFNKFQITPINITTVLIIILFTLQERNVIYGFYEYLLEDSGPQWITIVSVKQ